MSILGVAALLASIALAPAPPADAAEAGNLVEDNQVVVFYGTPRASGLGILGTFEPEEAARRLATQTRVFDRANGDRGAIGAMEVIYGMVTAEPGPRNDHVAYLKDSEIQPYLDLAEEYDHQVILDLQIGRNDPSDEIRKIERFLKNPRVHVAIDPEYAVGPHGVPIVNSGRITGDEINEVQREVRRIVRKHNLPPKMVIVHQFMDHTIIDGEDVRRYGGINLILNMDAFGDVPAKIRMYEHFASKSWAHRNSYNVFLKQDSHISSEEELLKLDPMPDMFMYQ